ncbi:flagellar biosynthesis protein FlhB [Serpentinicella alkaliphila]|uniref:Flagellar biosynthetic protein FlhB n=1 Tax=Serpentinicella alkaliphila TaxID=1734049 RepID=A0A4R2TWK9_9FIRM|nr:flagellar biosynthesis protein FlhB [Serpentinicella alkaliphila]QUH26295.1 flagellar biosynthesis protein FlhB [Serpentinicella alkaliphila]TCQ05875.1 flagellar biosynthetic protein FlhB [Serpentinicella alkaliphila]
MEFIINLQLFSEEKTEKATPKKVKDSREKGQVLQSREINSAFVLLASFSTLYFLASYIGNMMKGFTIFVFENFLNIDYLLTYGAINRLYLLGIYTIFRITFPIGAICLLVGLICSYSQVGYLFTTKTLAPKLSKLNPLEGFKRLFSMKSLVELVKSLIKIIMVGFLVFRYVVSQINVLLSTIAMGIDSIVITITRVTINIALRAGMALLAIAILDYLFQKYDYEKNLKMTKQEVKEEYKQTEGNPQIKSKIKEKQRQIAMRRMMQDVPNADVIITNPTHFAIAIKYDPHKFEAPKVIAKGKDLIAQNIKKLAMEHNIPLVENKPLARTLFDLVDIDEFIPPDLYEAVAEVLAYVYQLNNRI